MEETNQTFNLTVLRSRGTYGDVYCFYFVNRLSASASDFYVNGGVMGGGPARLNFADGQQSANITFTINDDTVPENMERFEIGLTVQNAVGNGGVLVKSPTHAYVEIEANDDANGVFGFESPRSTFVEMKESENDEPGMYINGV